MVYQSIIKIMKERLEKIPVIKAKLLELEIILKTIKLKTDKIK